MDAAAATATTTTSKLGRHAQQVVAGLEGAQAAARVQATLSRGTVLVRELLVGCLAFLFRSDYYGRLGASLLVLVALAAAFAYSLARFVQVSLSIGRDLFVALFYAVLVVTCVAQMAAFYGEFMEGGFDALAAQHFAADAPPVPETAPPPPTWTFSWGWGRT
jgi:hypothetical protein